jgi:hypothetical protein
MIDNWRITFSEGDSGYLAVPTWQQSCLEDPIPLNLEYPLVEMLSLLRTDPEVYDDKKQKHLKRFHSKVVIK